MALLLSTILFVVVGGLVALFGYHRYVLAGRVYEEFGETPSGQRRFRECAEPGFFFGQENRDGDLAQAPGLG